MSRTRQAPPTAVVGLTPEALRWAPVRSAYPHASIGSRLGMLALTALTAGGLGLLAIYSLNTSNRFSRRLLCQAVLLDLDLPAYDVVLPETSGGHPGQAEAGAEPGPGATVQDNVARVADLAPPEPVLAREAQDVEQTFDLRPAQPTPLPRGGGSPGGSGGQGGGNGGPGGYGGARKMIGSALASGNPTLKLEDMVIVHQEFPDYPTHAIYGNIAGQVTVEVLVSEHGVPLKTKVVASPHRILSEEALKRAPLWRFKPVLVAGKAVKVNLIIYFLFTLVKKNGELKPYWPALPVASGD